MSSAPPESATLNMAAALDELDANEMDCMPLNDDFDEDEFHECTTFSEDDEGNIIVNAGII